MKTVCVKFERVGALAAVCALGVVGSALAGPLNPPAGAVAPTPGPEPRIAINAVNTPGDNDESPSTFKIVQPGSYYLTGNVTGEAGKAGIEILGEFVTIDLNGFVLQGVPNSRSGITIAPLIFPQGIHVKNGTVRSWGGGGVALATNNASVTDVHVFDNVGSGIIVDSFCVIARCTAEGNSQDGIRTIGRCVVTHCLSSNNNQNGFIIGTGSVVSECVASLNTLDGFSVSSSSTVQHCTASSNTGNGINLFSNCLILANNCNGNGAGAGNGAGILAVNSDNRIEGNNCTDSDRGIDVDGAGNIIIKNTCSGNNTNYSFVADNYYGPIILRTDVSTFPVNGSTAAGTLATTDPHANFAY